MNTNTIRLRLLPVLLAYCLAPLAAALASVVPFDSFEPPYTIGNLNGQGGWTVVNVAGSSQAFVSQNTAYAGTQSGFLKDGDSANNPKAWREPIGTNTTSGQFEFAIKEDQNTSGRDYWTFVFSNVGSSTANFKLALSSATTLTLYGGSNGSTVLATVSTTSAGGVYSTTGWNTFSVLFNETTNTASVYLNGGSTPILSSSDTATNWTIGRYQVSPGSSTFTDMAIYFDDAQQLPEWETTNKLRYAPKTLVAPTIWAPSAGFNTRTFATDEDVIVQLSSTTTRTGNLGIVSGRNVRIIGGDLGSTYIAPTGQRQSLFIEGLKANHAVSLPTSNGVPVELNGTRQTGCQEKDAMQVCGVAGGPYANVFIQNCSIKGVHGTSLAHGPAINVSSINCTSVGPGNNFAVTITTSSSFTLPAGESWLIIGGGTEPKLYGTYRVNLASSFSGTTINAVRWDNWNSLPTAPFGAGTNGTGGYLWVPNPAVASLHADGYQSMAEGMYNIAYFYRVSIESNAECYLGMNQLNTQGMKGLVMTRVNMSVNNIWPQNYDSASLYIGTTDQSGGGWGTNGFPVTLDRVFIKPRPSRTLVAAVYPGIGTTRNSADVAAFSTDGGLTVQWPSVMGVTGVVTKSTNGFPGESGYTTKDYADLTGANAPGLNYVSPGYAAGTIQSLNMSAVTGTPAITGTITVPVNAAIGTVVTRLDVAFTGDGKIIDLSLVDGSGKFGMDTVNKRNVVVKSALATGTFGVTATATENGNSSNTRTQAFNIQVQ